ncbi:Dehydrogenase orsE [Lachnellula suecica]|uniref:Dehydrogenase orsE n=1 Tax=Lachnellula suecica TaxID=602035 RepID=A0A8T9CHF7_9HELO|nr:Dehydrogenase orsE [Lachnellula suecica]
MTSGETQNAIFVTEIGKPVMAGTREIPTPGPGEVLIKVTATQLLPHDTYARDSGLFIADHLPYVLGTNIAGTVQSLNPKYSIGQHISGAGDPAAPIPDFAGLQEYSLLLLANSALVPIGKSDDEAATLPVNAVTSFAALFNPKWFGFPPPWSPAAASFDYGAQSIVIIGAGSDCGRLALQFAKSVGIGTVVGIASLSGEKELRKFGATHVVDRHQEQSAIVKQVRQILGGEEGVTRVYDCVNWTFELAVALVTKDEESLVATLHQPRTVGELLARDGKSKAQVRFVSGAAPQWGEEDTVEFWAWLKGAVENGVVTIPSFRVLEGLDVEKVNEALDSYRDGSKVLHAVVRPGGKA